MKYEFTIIGDHYQFYLEDESSSADTSDIWDDKSSIQMFVIASGLIGIGTARYGGETNVTIEINAHRPIDSFDVWDQVAECSIEIASGHCVVSSPETDFRKAPRFMVPRGTYQSMIFWGNLKSVIDENASAGDDHYRIVLWPGIPIPPRIIKVRS